ncbi:hypothetical protein PTSG_09862 [Salpingoeca rosetta]|uniref:Uncharacterized protein n=1 Tax=Salpingoeca rosetta (strain ATCC 50818 / BSB-021) TaxID=946362 RepID=F2UNC7_SALR5|nr:uncharacterized protein PTSG_09862 [Salpingoeca rosetta]EGD79132.1 hypothetical protein PTSG_09862 [Salpingoeca rosetta]|eukprot:XP_004989217.1 hypothetical protein PTSG_09862 [Salpingoeca rosetta]
MYEMMQHIVAKWQTSDSNSDTCSSSNDDSRHRSGDHPQPASLCNHFAASVGDSFTVLYISRDADVVRQRQMEEGVAGLWKAERISAVDGAERDNVMKRLAGTPQEAQSSVEQLVAQPNKPPAVHLKEAAVAISHLDAIQRLPEGWKLVRLAMTTYEHEWNKILKEWQGEAAFAPNSTDVMRMPFVELDAADPTQPLKVWLEKLPVFPCIVSDECILDRIAANHMYIASPPLLNIPEGRLDQPDSTVRDHVKDFHVSSRLHSLDWAAHKFHECTTKAPDQRMMANLDCGDVVPPPS